MKIRLPLLRSLALVLSLLLLLAPAHGQALRGTFAAGASHSLSIHADGTLWATGSNKFGQLGIAATTASTSAWVQVGTATNWVQVAAGSYHSLALRADGTLWAWGHNTYGELGNTTNNGIGSAPPNPTPTQVGTERYTQVAAGEYHSLGLRADGSLWAWGYNFYGQLGNTTNTGGGPTFAANPTPTQVGTERYTQVAAGYGHSLGLRADGSLWAWGINQYGELGTTTNSGMSNPNPTPTRVGTALYTQVAGGAGHSLGLRPDGSLWAWGRNDYGQLGNAVGNGTYAPNSTPARVGTAVYTQVAAGVTHSLGLRADGTLYAWGDNSYGQLGDPATNGSSTANPTPTQVGTGRYAQAVAGEYHSLGLRADGALLTWGINDTGQLGTTGPATATPTATGTALPTRSTAAGGGHGLAVKADGTLWAWGDNSYGQLGDGTTTASLRPKQVGTDHDWVMVAAGYAHSLGLKADGSLYAWGWNRYGQLGDPSTSGSFTANALPTRIAGTYTQVAAAFDHSLALRQDGTLWAWGNNYYGQLGSATGSGIDMANPTPTQVAGTYSRLAVGSAFSLGLRADGTLWAWGHNNSGQLGSLANSGTEKPTPTPSQVAGTYTHVAAGSSHVLALRADGSLFAWGNNFSGQLGSPTNTGTNTANPTPSQVAGTYTQVAAGTEHSLALRAEGSLLTWGNNRFGQLGNGTTSSSTAASAIPTQEATGSTAWTTLAPGPLSYSSLVRTASGLAFASAGFNNTGQLGDGTTTDANRFDRQSPLVSLQPLPVLAAGPAGPALSLYPNPAPGRATALHGATPGSPVQVLDALGRPVLATTADATGTAALHLPTGLAAGVYLVRAGTATLRLAVE